MSRSDTITERISVVRDRIANAAVKSGRSPQEITLIGVSKTNPPEAIRAAIAAGLTDFGENRIQEAEEKIPVLREENVTWHMMGHLQRNKAQNALELFHWFHSLDSKRLARRLQQQMNKREIPGQFDVFIQVNVSGEKSKYGIPPERVAELIALVGEECPALNVHGLMTIAPFTREESVLRATFRGLRELQENIRVTEYNNIKLDQLSMGMTNDYEIAVEEGATHVRIGRALFGERQY